MTIYSLLEELESSSRTSTAKGAAFERLIATYLLTDPQYANQLDKVWLWNDWPDRWGSDAGIDLVARTKGTNEYWAIQCKFYDRRATVSKRDIDTFLADSGRRFPTSHGDATFSARLIFSTTFSWGKQAERAITDQSIPVACIGMQTLADSPVDWDRFRVDATTVMALRPRKELRTHQREALEAVREGFAIQDRGQLIMACGTGKTFTSLRIAEELTPSTARILFLAPSISLISQSLREWTAEAREPFHALAVCSDTKVGKTEEDIRTTDLAYITTTNAERLYSSMAQLGRDQRTVIFSTYQSIDTVIEAQRLGIGDFDLIICDEAHRTTGITLGDESASDFVKVHDQSLIHANKRLYMTATPRIYADSSKTKATEKSAVLYSMDDEQRFGPEFYRLGFGKAVDLDLLSDYKVVIVAVDEDRMAALANEYNSYRVDENRAIDTSFAAKVIGSWKGLSKSDLISVEEDGSQLGAQIDDPRPMRRAVAFARSIKNSETVTAAFQQLVSTYKENLDTADSGLTNCTLAHVDGTMNALKRQEFLSWLKDDPPANECRILSNARCLSEGIDVPALDAVIFFETRDSIVDIVQSVGRVMRKAEDKKFGYIILPVGIPLSKIKDYNGYIDRDPSFKGIWKVLKALRAHDESLVDEAEFRRKVKVMDATRDSADERGDQLPLDYPLLPFGDLADAIYAFLPNKLGDREYWSDWAKNVADISARLLERISALLERPDAREVFNDFVDGLRANINPSIDDAQALEMLVQHVLTRPVFDALFTDGTSMTNNPVSEALEAVVGLLDDHAIGSEAESLTNFYNRVAERVSLAKSDHSRQEIIRNLYDTFFKTAFSKMSERLGIVYTPIQIVDFILHSTEAAIAKHFDQHITNPGVKVLDPFTGTGTFIVRLLQSGLIKEEDLASKYEHELFANEIVLLAYYIASVNIETAHHAVTGEHAPFDGVILTDTFQLDEDGTKLDSWILPENNQRVERERAQDIRVIVSNPPYSALQERANDNNANVTYRDLDGKIRSTYAARSVATNKNSLYDSYIRAIRWASDRIGDQGIIGYVTNGYFLDSSVADGMRKCLIDEFSYLYVINLRGDQRTAGEISRREGGKVFGTGSRSRVAIIIMVKDPKHFGPAELNYYDIGDYLSAEEKLARLEGFKSIDGIPWEQLIPNEEGDWINRRDPFFESFIELGNKKDKSVNTIFSTYSRGILSGRDPWAYNFSSDALATTMAGMIDVYNEQVPRYRDALAESIRPLRVEDVVDLDPRRINWDSTLLAGAAKGRQQSFDATHVVRSLYRPFTKEWLYFDRAFNSGVYLMPSLFPTPRHENLVIGVSGIGSRIPFSALITGHIPEVQLLNNAQHFPRYFYEKASAETDIFAEPTAGQGDTYVRRDAITDWALDRFRTHYHDDTITKDAIFWYVYGLLHAPGYRKRFGDTLKKMLPRIPLVDDFWGFANGGERLGRLHLSYETIEPYPLPEESTHKLAPEDYQVVKMRFDKVNGVEDRSRIRYNEHLTLAGIPDRAHDYIVNGRSAIGWIMERYQLKTDPDSGIVNDPNSYSADPRYIVDLLKRVVQVSIKTMEIIEQLPECVMETTES